VEITGGGFDPGDAYAAVEPRPTPSKNIIKHNAHDTAVVAVAVAVADGVRSPRLAEETREARGLDARVADVFADVFADVVVVVGRCCTRCMCITVVCIIIAYVCTYTVAAVCSEVQ
jgi:ABC-type spermidine/putrescine transport system permease subunit I